MQIDITSITARVYAENLSKSILYVSVAIPSLKMWIGHCTVRPSTKYDDLWFQMPQFWIGKSWAEPVEFRGDSPFPDLIRDAAMRAVDQHIHDNKLEALFKSANHTRNVVTRYMMHKQLSHTPHSSLYSKESYICNLSKQHTGISTVGFWLIGNLYSLLVTSAWWK